MLEESQGVTHNLAGTLVAATTDLILDELLEMGTNDVTVHAIPPYSSSSEITSRTRLELRSEGSSWCRSWTRLH